MCVGALLESDVEALVFAVPEPGRRRGRHRSSSWPSTPACRARLKVVSGIRRDEAEELFASAASTRPA